MSLIVPLLDQKFGHVMHVNEFAFFTFKDKVEDLNLHSLLATVIVSVRIWVHHFIQALILRT